MRTAHRGSMVRDLVAGLAAPLIAVLVVAMLFGASRLDMRDESDMEREFQNSLDASFEGCAVEHQSSVRWFEGIPLCHFLKSEGRSGKFILWGDSQAQQLFPGLEKFARHFASGVYLMEVAAPEKPALLDSWSISKSDLILFSLLYSDFTGVDFESFEQIIKSTLATGASLVIIQQVPIPPQNPQICVNPPIVKLREPCSFRLENQDGRFSSADFRVRQIATELQVPFIETHRALCPQGICTMVGEGSQPLFRDRQHLTIAGSLVVGDWIARELSLRGLQP